MLNPPTWSCTRSTAHRTAQSSATGLHLVDGSPDLSRSLYEATGLAGQRSSRVPATSHPHVLEVVVCHWIRRECVSRTPYGAS
ncbi:uncharacterized protein B0H18DRAFT_1018691, partial [Fomitopsis serialis]|uniref:uncharacterized protein n=1 Tax=Fomitopsis serialis TaxID=139415 RepID=UPI00200857D4